MLIINGYGYCQSFARASQYLTALVSHKKYKRNCSYQRSQTKQNNFIFTSKFDVHSPMLIKSYPTALLNK